MELTAKARKELQEVMRRVYGVSLSGTEANRLGVSLLRLTQLVRKAPRAKTSVQ